LPEAETAPDTDTDTDTGTDTNTSTNTDTNMTTDTDTKTEIEYFTYPWAVNTQILHWPSQTNDGSAEYVVAQ
jgi:hypothetical protein